MLDFMNSMSINKLNIQNITHGIFTQYVYFITLLNKQGEQYVAIKPLVWLVDVCSETQLSP